MTDENPAENLHLQLATAESVIASLLILSRGPWTYSKQNADRVELIRGVLSNYKFSAQK